MAVTQKSKIIIDINAGLTDPQDLSTPGDQIDYSFVWDFAHGTGADAASMTYRGTRTLTASANESLDLSGGLTNIFGVAIVFTKIKAMIVVARRTNTNNVVVSRPATNGVPIFDAASDAITLKPGAGFALVDPSSAGFNVTPATGDLINFANSAGGSSVIYDLILIGAN